MVGIRGARAGYDQVSSMDSESYVGLRGRMRNDSDLSLVAEVALVSNLMTLGLPGLVMLGLSRLMIVLRGPTPMIVMWDMMSLIHSRLRDLTI